MFILLIALTVFFMYLSWMVQTDFGKVTVRNVKFKDYNGKIIAAKLMIPKGVSKDNPAPGIIYLHGYQNNKETNAPYCIEAARRGFVVLNVDTLGRGKSQAQINEYKKGFDPLYGAERAWEYLLELPMVDPGRSGLMGHSLGAEIVYAVALKDPRESALVTSGFAWTEDAGPDNPRNMLMIFGKYDEYLKRMTGTKDFEKEWLAKPFVHKITGTENPEPEKIYGSFKDGTARMIHRPSTTHIRESFDPGSISAALTWLKKALGPDSSYWIDPDKQIWKIKETSSLLAMIFGIMAVIPLSFLLAGSSFFKGIKTERDFAYHADRKTVLKYSLTNGLIMFLYLPLILILFAVHVYVIRVDFVFPLMMVNGVLAWFLGTNLIGYLLFKRWKRKEIAGGRITEEDLGLAAPKPLVVKTLIFSFALFLSIYLIEAVPGKIFSSDYRYIFPYADSFTPFRALLFIEYSLLFFPGFKQLHRFLFIQLRPEPKKTLFGTWINDSLRAIAVMVIPIIIMMAAQYVPLFTAGIVPFTGPGSSLVGFMMNLEHMAVLLSLLLPIGAWLYRLTGNICAGSITSAMIAAWFFTTSSVIAPIPV